jgi:Domain of unknown function (DUF4331)
MFHGQWRQSTQFTFMVILASMVIAISAPAIRAADHAEATAVAGDPGADLADVFVFLNPNDNSQVILALDVEGFVVPSELLNLSFFAPEVLYRFEIENTGDATPDLVLDITFSPQTSRSAPQTATITLPNGHRFTAPTTVQTLGSVANPFVVTTDPDSGVSFFAGLTDDPFFFDIVGFNRFVASVLGGSPDPAQLARSRDSFAGYNIHIRGAARHLWRGRRGLDRAQSRQDCRSPKRYTRGPALRDPRCAPLVSCRDDCQDCRGSRLCTSLPDPGAYPQPGI